MNSDALAAVNNWRGRCLNVFARGEKTVGSTLELAVSSGITCKLRHLAGQRLADLEILGSEASATPGQAKSLAVAIQRWRDVEQHRQYLAHGVATVSYNDFGTWYVFLDIVTYRANVPAPQRWAVSQAEGESFESELFSAFEQLSAQLGQVRKRLRPA